VLRNGQNGDDPTAEDVRQQARKYTSGSHGPDVLEQGN